MRNEKPEIHALEEVRYPSMSHITLKNQIPLDVIPFGPQEFVRLDVVFGLGTQIQPKFFVASFMHKLMREGTLHHSSKQIAEKIDFYGASLTSYALKKYIVFSLSLNTNNNANIISGSTIFITFNLLIIFIKSPLC